jgi:hypothetical protein
VVTELCPVPAGRSPATTVPDFSFHTGMERKRSRSQYQWSSVSVEISIGTGNGFKTLLKGTKNEIISSRICP